MGNNVEAVGHGVGRELVRLTQLRSEIIKPAQSDDEKPVRLKQYIGVDADGVEFVYREFTSDQDDAESKWLAADPIWGTSKGCIQGKEHARLIIRHFLLKMMVCLLLEDGEVERAQSIAYGLLLHGSLGANMHADTSLLKSTGSLTKADEPMPT